MIALISTEFTKAARRTRTLIIAFVLIGLPTAVAIAVNSQGAENRRADPNDVMFVLAQQSGLLVPVALLSAFGALVLIVIAGTFAGDSVAGDASGGNLRYLLMRPVARGRLLIAKTVVATALIWASTILVTVAALVAGIILFGAHGVDVPAHPGPDGALVDAFHLSIGELSARLAIATAYVAFGFTGLLALGVFFSTLTDIAASAISATVGLGILTVLLDSISALGPVRYAFPVHYLTSWTTMFTANEFSPDMVAGILVQVGYLVVFGGAAIHWFSRKDIRS